MKIKHFAFAVAGLIFTASSWALDPGSIEASLNNKAVQVEYERFVPGTSNLVMNASYTYSKKHDHAKAHIGTFGVQGIETDNANYRAALGARLYAYDFGDENGMAVAFGGLYYHAIPQAKRFSLGGHVWFAPEVTSFGDTEQLYEVGFRGAYRVINNTDIFAGYRLVKGKFKHSGIKYKENLESSIHLGFRLNF